MSFAALQSLFEDMLYSVHVTKVVHSTEGRAYARRRGLTEREYGLLVAVGPEAYQRACAVGTADLGLLFPATNVAMRAAGLDLDCLYGRFFDSDEGRDFNAPSRPDALAAYLRSRVKCKGFWSKERTALLGWECALMRAPPTPRQDSPLRLATGVQILEEPWDMPVWADAILEANAWVPPIGTRTWYALKADRMPGFGGRAQIWDIGPIMAAFLDEVARGRQHPPSEDTLEHHLLEHGRALGLIAPAEAWLSAGLGASSAGSSWAGVTTEGEEHEGQNGKPDLGNVAEE